MDFFRPDAPNGETAVTGGSNISFVGGGYYYVVGREGATSHDVSGSAFGICELTSDGHHSCVDHDEMVALVRRSAVRCDSRVQMHVV